MVNVSIRDVDKETWAEFKSGAAANDMKMSEYLEKLLEEAKEMNKNWTKVLYGKKSLSDEAAEEIKKASEEIRKNFKMRDLDW